MEFLKWLFTPGDFMPQGYCYNWAPGLVWLHLISDSLIFLAYMTIPFTLIHIARRRMSWSSRMGMGALFWPRRDGTSVRLRPRGIRWTAS